jgi:hypothetical protein
VGGGGMHGAGGSSGRVAGSWQDGRVEGEMQGACGSRWQDGRIA